jgi:hypothetical protein
MVIDRATRVRSVAMRQTEAGRSRLAALGKTVGNAVVHECLHGVKRLLPDYVFLYLSHRRRVGRFPHLVQPRTFNEMILQRCMRPDPRYAQLTDKLAVRDYVARKIGEEYLIPVLAAPEALTQAVFDALPREFVMKANHGCNYVKLVHDKSLTSFGELKNLADKWLSTNFYRESRERHYREIKPRIYFEKLLRASDGKIPADLKVHVFDPRGAATVYTVVISDRFGDVHGDFYDEHWNRLDIAVGDYPRSEHPVPRPVNWDDIRRLATTLAEDFEYVRVDLYAPEGKIFFGELTFTPGAGVFPFTPDRIDYEWGSLLKTARCRT